MSWRVNRERGHNAAVLAILMHGGDSVTDKMLYSLSIFLAGLGAGIALVAFVAPRSTRRLIGCKPEEDLRNGKTAASSH
jgi:hypothetical protein